MKRTMMICCLCMLFISGCTPHKGSFQDGNLDMESFFVDVNKQIDEKKIHMAFLNDIPFAKGTVEKAYHLDMTMIEDCMVKSALIPSQISEIAIFKVSKEHEQSVKNAIAYRMKALEKAWGSYNEDAKFIFYHALQGRIGKYYYFVLGEDSEKVVNYMKNGA